MRIGHSAEQVVVAGAEDGDFLRNVDFDPPAQVADPHAQSIVDAEYSQRFGQARQPSAGPLGKIGDLR